MENRVTVVLGSQWGDEGKGKIVDLLAPTMDMVCRCQGGNNAGHTVVVGDTIYDFHLLPSGMACNGTVNVLGSGMVIHLPGLFKEIEYNEAKGLTDWQGRLLVSKRAHLVFDLHQAVDRLEEERRGGKSLGTTKKGIGPAYSSKTARRNLRVCDLMGNFEEFQRRFRELGNYFQSIYPDADLKIESELAYLGTIRDQLRPLVRDTVCVLHRALSEGKEILVEGANAAMLDIDFGTYPYVTSSNCSIGGVSTGLGIPSSRVGNVVGVVKAYTTRVGAGVLPTEQENDIGSRLQSIGKEFGVTTGRKRRCGWLDLVVVKYTTMLNGYTSLAVTKLDILDGFDELKVAVGYRRNGEKIEDYPTSDQEYEGLEVDYVTLPGWLEPLHALRSYDALPEKAKAYVKTIEEVVGVPVQFVGVGQDRAAVIKLF